MVINIVRYTFMFVDQSLVCMAMSVAVLRIRGYVERCVMVIRWLLILYCDIAKDVVHT